MSRSPAPHTLIDSGHENKEYFLTGSESMTMHLAARKLSKCLNKDLRYIPVEPVATAQVFKNQGLSEWSAQALGGMFAEYGPGNYKFVSRDFKGITDESPRPIDRFFADFKEAFQRERVVPIGKTA